MKPGIRPRPPENLGKCFTCGMFAFLGQTDQLDHDLDHLGRTDQTDHDLDNLVPHLPL